MFQKHFYYYYITIFQNNPFTSSGLQGLKTHTLTISARQCSNKPSTRSVIQCFKKAFHECCSTTSQKNIYYFCDTMPQTIYLFTCSVLQCSKNKPVTILALQFLTHRPHSLVLYYTVSKKKFPLRILN